MVRGWCIALGIGLVLLWLSGIASPATSWLSWLVGVGALISFGIAGSIYPTTRARARSAAPLVLCLGLLALWIIGLATGATIWLCWWTFAFAVAYFLVGIAAARPSARVTYPSEPNETQGQPSSLDEAEIRRREEEERRRRSA